MQLAITILGLKSKHLINEVIDCVQECECHVNTISSTLMGSAVGAYVLAEGNWNHIAKLETTLESLQKKEDLQIQSLRVQDNGAPLQGLPFSIEVIGLDQVNLISSLLNFLLKNGTEIQEFSSIRYPAPFNQSLLCATKIVIIVPQDTPLLRLREDFIEFCDQHNIDAIMEPFKRC